jgi:hypothetical protein
VLIVWLHFQPGDGTEINNQVAAPAETRTPDLHPANKNRSAKSTDGGVATRARLGRRKPPVRGKNERTHLTSTGLLMESGFTRADQQVNGGFRSTDCGKSCGRSTAVFPEKRAAIDYVSVCQAMAKFHPQLPTTRGFSRGNRSPFTSVLEGRSSKFPSNLMAKA